MASSEAPPPGQTAVWECNVVGVWSPFRMDCQDFVEQCYLNFCRGRGEQRQRVRTTTPSGAPLYISLDFEAMTSKKVGTHHVDLKPIRRVFRPTDPEASASTRAWATFCIGGCALPAADQAILADAWRRYPRPSSVVLSDSRVVEAFEALELNEATCCGDPVDVMMRAQGVGAVTLPDELEIDNSQVSDFGSLLDATQVAKLAAEGGGAEECKICFCEMEHAEGVFGLQCGHAFHLACLEKWFAAKRQCPACMRNFGKVIGRQPSRGTMKWYLEGSQLPGHPRAAKTIVLSFNFPAGVHDDGQAYVERAPRCYLPFDTEGIVLLELYKVAFRRRVMFGFGQRLSDNSNGATFNIHIKTSRHKGMAEHGYPDPTYFSRSLEELRASGVTIADLPLPDSLVDASAATTVGLGSDAMEPVL